MEPSLQQDLMGHSTSGKIYLLSHVLYTYLRTVKCIIRDKDAKHRLKGYPNVGGTIAATAFNGVGSIFAYSISYDWSKGYQANTLQYPIKVMLHPMKEDEAKPRATNAAKKR